jgi:hypothetical protein
MSTSVHNDVKTEAGPGIILFSRCGVSVMNRLAQELDAKLRSLDPDRAQQLEAMVREAIMKAENGVAEESASQWPEGYFERTAGALAGETFERPPQGQLPNRDEW